MVDILIGLVEYIAMIASSYGLSFWYPVALIRMNIEGTYILEEKFAKWFPNYNKE